MRSFHIVLSLLFISTTALAQTIEDFVKEGIQYHDGGEFDKAIATYQKALEIDPNSALVHYELALSYFSKADYEKVIEHSDNVLEQNGDYMIQAYLTKGSALDVMGNTDASIKFFEEAIQKTEGHYLLYYNLAINYYKLGDLDNAESNVMGGIQFNPNHASSHLMLATIHNGRGNKVQTLLTSYYFLFLEPDSKRSPAVFSMLQENLGGNVSEDKEDPNNINILLNPGGDSEFGAAELMISLLEASKTLEENKGKTEDEMFVQNTESFFKILGELSEKDKKEGIWWGFYIPYFYELAKSDHMETYCKYITSGVNENSFQWLGENEAKLIAFDNWLQGN
ncbi:tetratricopeptide repeat protein [Aureisphaera galaxeae]|uniref:tetratricopeptide repeat protein n=1 Tax=Aureisphaera galaxeae TaxID=1538023 RepID=UPI0023506356|nr:tetratricopeptide repeat protein [Aureisphaera galaxeae]MDC8006123.1 tetratricopeptide repeat protein [Aureisphaera galaxeae]